MYNFSFTYAHKYNTTSFGLLSIYHTFCTLIAHIHNKFLLILFTIRIIFLQIAFIDLILPYNPKFNTKYLLFQSIYTLWHFFTANEPHKTGQYEIEQCFLQFLVSSDQLQKRSATQDVIRFSFFK